MDSEVQLRYQLEAAERIAERLRQQEGADAKLIAAFEALAGDARQRLDAAASQPSGRNPDAASPS